MTEKHARWLFRGATIYGLILILPMYFLEKTAASPDPQFTHPEFYYGFVGAAAAWQLVYWVIGGDPVRFRPMMALGVIAKFGFWTPTAILWAMGRTPTTTFALTCGDFVLGVAFFIAWRSLKTPA